jgi:hypothetical protein
MEYTVRIGDVVGGTKVEVWETHKRSPEGTISIESGPFVAFAAQPHQIPQRVKELFEVLYPKKDKAAK